MRGIRWTTGIGIAVGGVGGAIIALLGVPKAPPSVVQLGPTAAAIGEARESGAAPAESAAAPVELAPPAESAAAPAESAAAPAVTAPSALPAASVASPAAATTYRAVPPLELPTTRGALLKAEMFCDRKKDFDECSRAAEALEKGTAGPADGAQAKRFRKIALTYLVAECEAGSPHACFIMADKYRAGVELPASSVRAEALAKRGVELCRKRSAPECPAQ